jgi:hypothetical protein
MNWSQCQIDVHPYNPVFARNIAGRSTRLLEINEPT